MAIRKRIWTSGGETRSAWVVDYKDQHDKRRLKTFRTKRAATDWATTTGYEVKQGTHTAASASLTIKRAGELWIKAAEADGLERATTREYWNHLNLHILPRLGTVKLSDLSAPMVRELETWLQDNGRSPAMVRKVVSSLGSLLADAQEAGRVARNVVRERPKKRRQNGQSKRHKTRLEVGRDIPTAQEINASLTSLDGRARALFLAAARTGMRASELRALTWSDVDFKNTRLHVRRRADRWNKIGPTKSAAGQRTIPMTPMLANTLKEWKLACPRGELDLVFPNGAGNVENHGNIYARIFAPAWIAAGAVDEDGRARYGIHALRHFFASWLINEKSRGGLEVSLKRAQVLLGHSSLQMTADTYGHLLPAKNDEAAEFAEGEKALLA